jgi:hypothetical protein
MDLVIPNACKKVETEQGGPSDKFWNLKFNVFHVRALYNTKTINHQQNAQRVLSSIVTHSYMFRPCWDIFRENFLLWLHYGCTL